MNSERLELPKEVLNKMKPCWKCGAKPEVLKITDKYGLVYHSHLQICCQNKDCRNFYFPDGKDIITDEDIEKWNKLNVEKFVPKNEIKETDNCHKCKHYNACIYTREQHISEYCTGHICDDFEKRD